MKTIIALLLLAVPLSAGETKYWEVEKRSAFAAGVEFENLELTARGGLRLGHASGGVEAAGEPSFWAGLKEGEDVLAGSGTGNIYRLSGGKLQKVYSTNEMLVTAFAAWKGDVYAATIPNGKIFRRTGGKWGPFCLLKAKYVWALLPTDDGLLAATGNEGKVFRIDTNGGSSVWYETNTKNVLALAAAGGSVLLGTAGPGRLIRVSGGAGRVLHDFDTMEVKSISVDGEDVYVGLNTGTEKPPSEFLGSVENRKEEKVEPKAPKGEEGGSGEKGEGGKPEAPKKPTAGTSSIWKVSASRTHEVASFESAYITEIVRAEGGLFVGTDRSGRIFRVHDDGSYDLVFDLKENQVLGFLREGDRVAGAFMGDRAAVRLFSKERAEAGAYLSEVFDAAYPSAWGSVESRGEGSFSIQTRSGNVADTEAGWSDWSTPLEGDPGRVPSPKGRYFQFRVLVKDPAAVVRGLTLAYKNENQAPQVRELKVEIVPARPGSGGQSGPSPRLGQGHATEKKIEWQGKDPDKDYLVYRLYYKPVEGGNWVPLLGAETMKKREFVWETENVPDGKYFVRVVASDEQANPAQEALTGEEVSDPILIDNTRPVVKIESVRGRSVRARADDASTHIFRFEYQVDGGDWQAVVCRDGIFDSKTEEFEFELPKLAAGPHTLTVRVLDRESNIGTASQAFTAD